MRALTPSEVIAGLDRAATSLQAARSELDTVEPHLGFAEEHSAARLAGIDCGAALRRVEALRKFLRAGRR